MNKLFLLLVLLLFNCQMGAGGCLSTLKPMSKKKKKVVRESDEDMPRTFDLEEDIQRIAKGKKVIDIIKDKDYSQEHTKNFIDPFLSQGADVNQVDDEGCSALYYACLYGYSLCAITLLEYGADPNLLPDKALTSPLHEAVKKEDEELIIKLLKSNASAEGSDYYDPVELPKGMDSYLSQ